MALSREDAVLDLGAGCGDVAAELAPLVSEYCGAELSDAALRACASQKAGCNHLRFERVDIANGPLPRAVSASGFTLVLGHSVLQYLPSQAAVDRLMAELSKVVAPTARLLLADLPAEGGATIDAASQLWHGLLGGYVAHVLWALAVAPISSYGRARREHGILRFSEARIRDIGATFGPEIRVLREPLTANRSRRHLFARRR